jgi:hypothetical protein
VDFFITLVNFFITLVIIFITLVIIFITPVNFFITLVNFFITLVMKKSTHVIMLPTPVDGFITLVMIFITHVIISITHVIIFITHVIIFITPVDGLPTPVGGFITLVIIFITHVDVFITSVDFFITSVIVFPSFFATHLLHFLGRLSVVPNTNGRQLMAAGRMEEDIMDVLLFEFEVAGVLSWCCEVLWVVVVSVVMVEVLSSRMMCLSVREVSVTSMRCEASLLHRAAEYVTTAGQQEQDTLYI